MCQVLEVSRSGYYAWIKRPNFVIGVRSVHDGYFSVDNKGRAKDIKGDTRYYSQELFENEELIGYLNSNMEKCKKSIYEYVLCDSDVEREFLESLESDDDVKLYIKLPDWFKISTPIGSYNPDWAILIEVDGVEKLYFVVENKGSTDEGQLRMYESFKIACGMKHFAALGTGVEYKVATGLEEIKMG